jgi:uncharacterized membrane protein YedE/YeeE
MGKYQEGIQTVFVVLATIITLYFQFSGDRSVESVAFFGIMVILIIFYFSYSYIKDKFSQIEINSAKIKKIEEKMDYMTELNSLKTRIAIMEDRMKKKKGQFDPKIIIIIFIIVVLLLYLRSIGIFNF